MTAINLDAIRARHASAVMPRSSWSYASASADDVPTLLAEVERLRAQLPEGGKWVTQYRHRNAPGALPASGWMDHAPDDPADCVTNGCEQRRVYTTAVEPIVALDRVTEAGRGRTT